MRKRNVVQIALYIGRFAPFHNGHMRVVQHGLKAYDKLLILVGSADRAIDSRTPWTALQRTAMVIDSISPNVPLEKLEVSCLRDYPFDDDTWCAQVREKIEEFTKRRKIKSYIITLLGKWKDHTSDYLNFLGFRRDSIPDSALDPREKLSGTILRELMIEETLVDMPVSKGLNSMLALNMMPRNSYKVVEPTLPKLREEYNKIATSCGLYGTGPFMATDCLVTKGDYILLVTRKPTAIGGGRLAMPGGYLEKDLTLAQNAQKELKEETNLQLPIDKFKNPRIIDNVNRCGHSRILTAVFRIKLPTLNKALVFGGDDAAVAKWYKLDNLIPTSFHDDHYHIIEDILNV